MQVNFLSKIRLYHKGDGPNVAKRLIDVYFALFKVLWPLFSVSFSVLNHKHVCKHLIICNKTYIQVISPLFTID